MTRHRPERPDTIRPANCCSLGPLASCHDGRALDCCSILGNDAANAKGYTCFIPEPEDPIGVVPVDPQPVVIEEDIPGEPIPEPVTQNQAVENIPITEEEIKPEEPLPDPSTQNEVLQNIEKCTC